MKLHLIDGTYELFRMYFGAPKTPLADGREVGATRAFLRSMLSMLTDDEVTHVGVAFDHVIESFRNDLFDGYKTGLGIDPDLWDQSPLVQEAAAALGMTVWPMVEFEADDALAAAAAQHRDQVDQVVICTPDKDLAQCVRGDRVVLFDRRRDQVFDAAGVVEKFGVPPASIPDFLALVGDAADGIPGVPRWGKTSAAKLLMEYGHVPEIPSSSDDWATTVRGAKGLAENLRSHREEVELYVILATLREDVPLPQSLEDLRWQGPNWDRLESLCTEIADDRFLGMARGRVKSA